MPAIEMRLLIAFASWWVVIQLSLDFRTCSTGSATAVGTSRHWIQWNPLRASLAVSRY